MKTIFGDQSKLGLSSLFKKAIRGEIDPVLTESIKAGRHGVWMQENRSASFERMIALMECESLLSLVFGEQERLAIGLRTNPGFDDARRERRSPDRPQKPREADQEIGVPRSITLYREAL